MRDLLQPQRTPQLAPLCEQGNQAAVVGPKELLQDQEGKELRLRVVYPVSIGEWISLYERNELDIHPEFQRFFRWSPKQKSRLIESILLGIPIPPIFVAQRPDGVWDVVDGLQRLSTILQFVGILKQEDGTLVGPLTLESTKYLPSLGGHRWDDPESPEASLTTAQRLIIKRRKLTRASSSGRATRKRSTNCSRG